MPKFNLWPAGIFALLGLNVIVVATTVAIATHSDSTVVESRPYERALKWDEEQRKRQASDALHWTCQATFVAPDTHAAAATVKLSFTDLEKKPVEGLNVGVVSFHHAHATDRHIVTLVPSQDAPGVYEGTIDAPAGLPLGLWRLSIAANRLAGTPPVDQQFEQTTDLMLTIKSSAPPAP